MSYLSEVTSDSPTCHLRLGDAVGAGTCLDNTSNHLNGTPSNVTLGVAGLLTGDADTAASFNGTSSKVDLGNPAALRITGQITLECVYKPASFPTAGNIHALLAKGYDGTKEGYYLRLYNNSGTLALQAGCFDGTGNVVASWPVSGWSAGTKAHVAGKYDGSAWHVYFNGAEVGTPATGSGPQSTASNVYIGAEDVSGVDDRSVAGVVDEPAIYSASLSDSRIAAHAAAAVGGAPLAAGSLSLTSKTDTTAHLSYGTVSGGTATYSNQLQRSTVSGSGFADVGSPVIGTTATFTDTGRAPNTTYYYRVVTTDSAGTPVTVTSGELAVTTWTAAQATYVTLGFGIFLVYGMSTAQNFTGGAGNEYGDGTAPASTFNAIGPNADVDQWLDAAIAGGATYVVFTAVHVSGFCLWNTATTAYKAQRDFLAEMGPKCRARGLKFGVYWTPWQEHQKITWTSYSNANWVPFWQAQIAELGAYSPDILWVDGYGYVPPNDSLGVSFGDFPYVTFAAAASSAMPSAAVIVNTHELTTAHSLVIVRETAVDGTTPSSNTAPVEETETTRSDGKWFWGTQSYTPMSEATIAANRSRINGRSAAYLPNFPPNTAGVIPATERASLQTMGLGLASGLAVYAPTTTGTYGVASPDVTVYATGGSFSGTQTVTVTASNGTLTAVASGGSVSQNNTGAVTVTPPNGATSFTFTYTPASVGAKTLTFTNGQSWSNPAPTTYTATSAGTTTATGYAVYVTGPHVKGQVDTVTIVASPAGAIFPTGTITVTDTPNTDYSTNTPIAVGGLTTTSYNVTPNNTGAHGLTFVNSTTLTDANSQPITVAPVATGYTVTIPNPQVGQPCTVIVTATPAGAVFAASQSVTVTDVSTGGDFSSGVIDVSGIATYTYTVMPTLAGAHTVDYTSSPVGLTDPGEATVTVAPAPVWTSIANVRNGTDVGNGTIGTLKVPTRTDVFLGTQVDATTGTLTLVSGTAVLSTAGTFGRGGNSVTPTYVAVSATNVKSGVTFGASSGQTGSYVVTLPSVTNVLNSITYGAPQQSLTGTHVDSGTGGGGGIPISTNTALCNVGVTCYSTTGTALAGAIIEYQVFNTNTTGRAYTGTWAQAVADSSGVATCTMVVGERYRLRLDSGTPGFYVPPASGAAVLSIDLQGRLQT